MTSEERREARYKRRVAARNAKKRAALSAYDNYDKVFSFENLYKGYQLSRRGVCWKASVQKYVINAPVNVMNTYYRLKEGKYRTPGFYEFDIHERGKKRHIRSTTIGERIVQRCLCDNALVPALTRTLIYDNGASMKDKGYDFAVRRITCHLQKHFRKHGNEGYILLFDFRKFFDNISHALVKHIVNNELTDPRLRQIIHHFIDAFGDKGLGLGSQISQVLALASANRLDHYIKERLRIKLYGRYNDDGYLIHESKDVLKKCLVLIRKVCDYLKIELNEKKTQIVKLSHGFTWLKVRFFLTETGRIIKKINPRSITVQRRKLKKLHKKYLQGLIPYEGIRDSFLSWAAYSRKFSAYHTFVNMRELFESLFFEETRGARWIITKSSVKMAA